MRKLSEVHIKEIRQEYLSGKTMQCVAKETGYCCSTIFKYCYGLRSRGKKRLYSDRVLSASELGRHQRYKLRQEDYDRLVLKQNGLCAICHQAKKLFVDHDHQCCSTQRTCGKCIRGLLCISCNNILGIIERAGTLKLFHNYIATYNGSFIST